MKRKIVEQAGHALTVTLPIKWARMNNINKNSEVDLEIDGKRLFIINEKSVHSKKVMLDIEGLDTRNAYRHINALYAKGIDEIEVNGTGLTQEKIRKLIDNTIGYAIVSHKEDKFIIKDIGGGNYNELDEIFKRVFQLVMGFFEECIEDVFGEEKETMDGLLLRDREVNKFCLFLQRAINKMGYRDSENLRALFTLTFELEKISDEIERFWRENIKNNIEKNKKIKNLANDSLEAFGMGFICYYQFKGGKIQELYKLRDKIREDSLNIKVKNKSTISAIRHLVNISEMAADLSHLILMIRQ